MLKIKTGLLAMAMCAFATFAAAQSSEFQSLPELTRLQIAAASGHVPTVTAILRNGVDPDVQLNDDNPASTPLITAITFGRYNVVEALLEWGADPNFEYEGVRLPLWWALHHGQYNIAKLLRSYGARK